jgi:hypothetical protein
VLRLTRARGSGTFPAAQTPGTLVNPVPSTSGKPASLRSQPRPASRLGIGIGFFLIFGFAAWLVVPSRVSNIRAEHIGSAIGLMLTLAAIGGFFMRSSSDTSCPHTSYGAGWVFLAVVSAAFALVGLKGGNPVTVGSP